MTYDSAGEFKVKTTVPRVAHVELHRRLQRDAAIRSGWGELRLIFERLSCDPEIRVVVLSGMEEEDFHAPGKDGKGEGLKRSMQDCINTILSCPKRKYICIGTPFPVSLLCLTGRELMKLIAVICVTLGMYRTQSMGLISACDIRISASSASFAIKHTDIGHSLSLQLLQKLVGSSSWICDVAFSGREFDASEASRVGFVTRVVEGDDDALRESFKLAEVIAARSPSFLQKLKQELWRIRKLRASIQSAKKYTHDYSEAELANDLDQALGVDTQKRTRGDSEAQMAADLDNTNGIGKARRIVTREKL